MLPAGPGNLPGGRDGLDRLARTLMDPETLDEDEAYGAAGIPPRHRPAAIAGGRGKMTTLESVARDRNGHVRRLARPACRPAGPGGRARCAGTLRLPRRDRRQRGGAGGAAALTVIS
jgi:hypothetical protein